MKDYHINIFYSDEDEGYIADIPDLIHCSAFGETPEAALSDAIKEKICGLNRRAIAESRFQSLIIGLLFTRLLEL
jgi:hypothetical protein